MTVNPFITDPQFYPTFDQRLQPDRNAGNAMLDYQNALTTKGQLAETVRRATARAQAADAQRKMQLFQSMTPDQLKRIYSGAPQSASEAEMQSTIAGYENAGNQGFQLGWQSDRQHQIDAEREAELQRHVRDSNLSYQIKLGDEADKERLFQLKQDAENRLQDQGATKLDLQKQKIESQNTARAEKVQQSTFNDAYNAILDGALTSDQDINRQFPGLDVAAKETLSGYLRKRQTEDKQRFGEAAGQAQTWEEQLRPLREKADEAAALAAKKTKTEPGLSYYLNPFHYANPTESLANWYAENPPAPSGPRQLTPAESDLIQRAQKTTRGDVVYDPTTRTLVPRLSNRDSSAEQSPWYTPQVRGASPDNPIATNTGSVGPQAPMNPLLGYFDTLQRGGAAPIDKEVATLNQRFPRVKEGASANNGQFVFSGGQWVRMR